MMTRAVYFAAILLSLASRLAFADAKADQHRYEVNDAAEAIDEFAANIHLMQHRGTMSEPSKLPEASDCAALIDKYKADIQPDERLNGQDFVDFPGAQKASDGWISIPFSSARGVCQTYQDLRALLVVAAPLEDDWSRTSEVKKNYDPKARVSEVGLHGDIGDAPIADATKCVGDVDAAIAGGAKADVPIYFRMTENLTLGDLRARCQDIVDWWPGAKAATVAEQQAQLQAIVDVYKQGGIKGKRLDLFVSYGMPENTGFFAAGCQDYVTSVAALKKAKKLFVWLEGDAGYTIRKFTFSGDSYKVTEKTYDTQEKAYRGCR